MAAKTVGFAGFIVIFSIVSSSYFHFFFFPTFGSICFIINFIFIHSSIIMNISLVLIFLGSDQFFILSMSQVCFCNEIVDFNFEMALLNRRSRPPSESTGYEIVAVGPQ
ncbi:hypothetical protein RIF29_34903 [Crotalaria pallida]|uniref:Uncharacterized protein n=1 Tax=Crotalaria pallida TaxID=3830 RepID=A0AAN9E9C6_CROPI